MPIHRYFLSDFVNIQRQSFFELLEKGLIEEFTKRNPINNTKKDLEFLFYPEYYILTRPEYTPQEAIVKNKSYTSKLFIPGQLTDIKNQKKILKWFYIGNLPLMTKRGHFILNGAARVIVNQILRSPGIYYQQKMYENYEEKWSQKPDDIYKRFYADLICMRGTWLRIEIDKEKNIWAQMKKGPKIPIYWFLLAMGLSEKKIFKTITDSYRLLGNLSNNDRTFFFESNLSDSKLSGLNKKNFLTFGSDNHNKHVNIEMTNAPFNIQKDSIANLNETNKLNNLNKKNKKKNDTHSKKYAYIKTPPEAWQAIYKLISLSSSNKTNIANSHLDNNVKIAIVNNNTSTNVKKTNESILNRNDNDLLSIQNIESKRKKEINLANEGRKWIYNKFMNSRSYNLGKQGRFAFNKKLDLNTDVTQTTLTGLDVLYATDYLIKVEKGIYKTDDIDHLKNRRVRTSGELILIQIGIGVVRLEKTIRDNLNKLNINQINPNINTNTNIINISDFLNSKKIKSDMNSNSNLKSLNTVSYLKTRYKKSQLFPSYTEGKRLLFLYEPLPFSFREANQIESLRSMAKRKKQKRQGTLITSSYNRGARGNYFAKENEEERNYKTKKNHINIKKTNSLFFNFINSKAFNSAIREFFGTSPLSQFMDQINPLAELTHKRRLSSMGPGGVTRDTATLAIRGIHPTHYGRICPIETPEGKNTGLVNSMTTYARINKNGIIESPFYKVYKGQVQKKTGMYYFSAEQEEKIKLAAADLSVSSIGFLPKSNIPVRIAEDFTKIPRSQVQYVGISPLQMISIAASLIPFLEHDDANRALMGSNMQRQAVPLIKPERPIVGTGLEARTISDSGHALLAKFSGLVTYVSSKKIVVYSLL